MDILIDHLDPVFFDHLYSGLLSSINPELCGFAAPNATYSIPNDDTPSDWLSQTCLFIQENLSNRQSSWRQGSSIFILTFLFHSSLFIFFGSFWYFFHFDQSLQANHRFRKNQIRQEIIESLTAIVAMDLTNVPAALLQIKGHSLLYNSVKDGPGLWYEILQYPLSVLFMDTGIYWLHRMFHSQLLYSRTHKAHHRFIISTPFAAFTFHPLEACIMSIPNLIVPFVMPMSKIAYLLLLLYGNMEAVVSHDSGQSFHTVHHLNAKKNYGQLTSIWDVLMDTYQNPRDYFDDTVRRTKIALEG